MDRRTFSVTIAERDAAVVRRIRAGETLEAVGKDYGISRERVRQIAVKSGLCPTENMRQRNDEKRNRKIAALLDKSRLNALYQANRYQIDAVMGESFLADVDVHRQNVQFRGAKSGERLRLMTPSRQRCVSKRGPNYWGIRVTTTDRYLLLVPDSRLFAVKPGTPIGKYIYVPFLGNSINHSTEPRYVEITK